MIRVMIVKLRILLNEVWDWVDQRTNIKMPGSKYKSDLLMSKHKQVSPEQNM